jgi:hypothetical protein
MNLGTAQAGHVVLADRWGRRFYAIVSSRGQGELQVEPIDRRVTSHPVTAREVLRSGNFSRSGMCGLLQSACVAVRQR